jgi:hypothetical protein
MGPGFRQGDVPCAVSLHHAQRLGKNGEFLPSLVGRAGKNPVKPSCKKYFCLSEYRIGRMVSSVPPPPQEGRLANVTTRAVGCDGRECADRRAALIAYGEVVWSWRPKVLAPQGPGAPRSWRQVLAKLESFAKGDGGKRDGSPRRARISRKTTAQGRPVVTACTCGFRARANIFCAGAPGAAATRPSLHPLFFGRVETMQSSDEFRRENENVCPLPRHCEERWRRPRPPKRTCAKAEAIQSRVRGS